MKKLLLTVVLGIFLTLGINAQIVPPMTGQVINTKIVDPTHLQIRFRSNTGYTFGSIEAGDIYAVKSGANIVRYFISSTSTAGFHPGFDGTIAITPLDGYTGSIPTATPTASGYIYRPIGGIAPLEYQNQDYLNWAMVNWNLQSLRDSIGAGGGVSDGNGIYGGSDTIPDSTVAYLTQDFTIQTPGNPYDYTPYDYNEDYTGNFWGIRGRQFQIGASYSDSTYYYDVTDTYNNGGFEKDFSSSLRGGNSYYQNYFYQSNTMADQQISKFISGEESRNNRVWQFSIDARVQDGHIFNSLSTNYNNSGGAMRTNSLINTGSDSSAVSPATASYFLVRKPGLPQYNAIAGLGKDGVATSVNTYGGNTFSVYNNLDTTMQFKVGLNNASVSPNTSFYPFTIDVFKINDNSIRLYEKYNLPNTQPSTTNLAKSVMTWTGDGSTTAPSFEVQPKKYVALLTQTGTGAPVATVLENTLGGTVVWTRTNVGIYRATLPGVFTANKTWGIIIADINSSTDRLTIDCVSNTPDYITVNTVDSVGDPVDGMISYIEIRVYP